MLRVTWEWLGQGLALDLSNTVAIADGTEHDLIGSTHDYEQWATGEANFVPGGSLRLLRDARNELLDLRTAIRSCLIAVAAGERAPKRAVAVLNRASSEAPLWLELDADASTLRERSSAPVVDTVVARYARSAIELLATEANLLRRCPAPSCGMFYLSSREGQRWCSPQCGTRARVARHYHSKRRAPASR
jgi:predicted RNA-binding Zn ribbon-like protein